MRTVALYGNSLVLSSVGASLNGCAGLQVVAIDPAQSGAVERMLTLRPDVIVFDTDVANPDSAIVLWKAQPSVLLIGVDLATDRVLVLSGQSSQLLTRGDLLDVIESQGLLERRK